MDVISRFSLIFNLNQSYLIPSNVRRNPKPIFYCLLSAKTCHYKHMGKSKSPEKTREKVRPESSISILHVLTFLFPELFAKRIVEI